MFSVLEGAPYFLFDFIGEEDESLLEELDLLHQRWTQVVLVVVSDAELLKLVYAHFVFPRPHLCKFLFAAYRSTVVFAHSEAPFNRGRGMLVSYSL